MNPILMILVQVIETRWPAIKPFLDWLIQNFPVAAATRIIGEAMIHVQHGENIRDAFAKVLEKETIPVGSESPPA